MKSGRPVCSRHAHLPWSLACHFVPHMHICWVKYYVIYQDCTTLMLCSTNRLLKHCSTHVRSKQCRGLCMYDMYIESKSVGLYCMRHSKLPTWCMVYFIVWYGMVWYGTVWYNIVPIPWPTCHRAHEPTPAHPAPHLHGQGLWLQWTNQTQTQTQTQTLTQMQTQTHRPQQPLHGWKRSLMILHVVKMP